MKYIILKIFVLVSFIFCQVTKAESRTNDTTIKNTFSTSFKENVGIDLCIYFEKNNGFNYELSIDAFLGNYPADKDITISFDFSYELYAYGTHIARITDHISVTIPQGTDYLSKSIINSCPEFAENMTDMSVTNLITTSTSTKYNYYCAFSGLEGGY